VTLDIVWYGHSCFRLSERGQTTLVTDPYAPSIGLPELKLKADVVTVSHNEPGHSFVDAVKGTQRVIQSPGEYEIGGTFITGIAMHYIDEATGAARANVAYRIQYDSGLTVLHLGDLAALPDQSTVRDIGEVHVLLIPVGGGASLKPSLATEVIAMIEPGYVVPMHYALPGLAFELEPLDKFLKAMGVSRVNEQDVLRITTGEMPEQPQITVLTPQIKSEPTAR
jgi:L-ascorbate metabolism protein UlaG (beta-lactamase superfamily)